MKVKVQSLQNLLIFYVCIWVISPILAYGTIYRFLAVLSVIIWLATEFYNRTGIFRKVSLVSLLLLLYLLYSGLLSPISSDTFSFTSELQLIIMLFFLLVYESRKNCLESFGWIFWGVLSVFPIWSYLTLKALDSIGSNVARTVVRSSDEAKELVSQGVGGYGLVYSSVLLLPILIGLFFHLISIRHRVKDKNIETKKFYFYLFVVSLNIVLTSLLVIKAGYTIAISTSFFAILIIFMMKSFSYIRVILFALVAILYFIFQKELISYIANTLLFLTDSPIYTKKINDVVFSLASDNASGTVNDRVTLYSKSVDTFLENPIFGTMSYKDVGGHSFVLDNYARWGLFFGSLLLYFIIFIPVKFLSIEKNSFGVWLAIIFSILSVFSLNTAVASFGVIIYLIIPCFYHFTQNYGIKETNFG